MINNIRKMRRTQQKVRAYLEKKGCLVHIIHHSRFSKDLFGLFDGFYIKDGIVTFFQVKTNTKPNLKPYQDFSEKYRVPINVFVVKDRKGVMEYSCETEA